MIATFQFAGLFAALIVFGACGHTLIAEANRVEPDAEGMGWLLAIMIASGLFAGGIFEALV